jgi:hypothetical protein
MLTRRRLGVNTVFSRLFEDDSFFVTYTSMTSWIFFCRNTTRRSTFESPTGLN